MEPSVTILFLSQTSVDSPSIQNLNIFPISKTSKNGKYPELNWGETLHRKTYTGCVEHPTYWLDGETIGVWGKQILGGGHRTYFVDGGNN